MHPKIKETVDKVQIFDTHEHLTSERERISRKPDPLNIFLAHYLSSDLISAGMTLDQLNRIQDKEDPLEERFEIFEPFWNKVINTGYARAISTAVEDLYGINEINGDTCNELTDKMEKKNTSGLYRWILKEKANIDISVLDRQFGPSGEVTRSYIKEIDKKFFAPVARFDDFIFVSNRTDVERIGRKCGRSIHSFDDLLESLEVEFRRVSERIVGIKLALAYNRNLCFDKVSKSVAEQVFNGIFRDEFFRSSAENYSLSGYYDKGGRIPAGISLDQAKPYQDFLVHKIIQLAAEENIPVQVHTGLQEGNENIVENSNPTQLVNLIREYQEVNFDIFHGSYPYVGELTALAKNYRNVYIDMCWLHVLSPYKARQALSEWLDVIPWTKIFGFGGDYIFPEGVYGHSMLARENISRVLNEKFEEGSLTEGQAIKLAKMLLRDNAKKFFFEKG